MCGGRAPFCAASSEVTRLCPPLPSACHGGPYLLQRPKDDGESEGYARAQEDGLRNDCEEELGLGGPATESQETSTSGLGLRKRAGVDGSRKTLESSVLGTMERQRQGLCHRRLCLPRLPTLLADLHSRMSGHQPKRYGGKGAVPAAHGGYGDRDGEGCPDLTKSLSD